MNGSGKFRILVVDDEASVLMTYRMILERQGYDVVTCPTWREAASTVATQDFDAVLCDYSLEQQHTGVEVIAAARSRDASLPAALLTGYANQETASEAASKNIAMMFKPIEIGEFLETTARMLRKDNERQKDSAPQDPAVDECARTTDHRFRREG